MFTFHDFVYIFGQAYGFEDLLYKYGVDLYFGGHVHAYER